MSELWGLRDKFSERRAGGIPFWLRHDDASNTTVVFTYTRGWLVIATRDDLTAKTLALLAAGAPAPASLAVEPWFQRAAAAAGNAGELRMVLNMDALVRDVRFRSYRIERNVSELRGFESGIADVSRRGTEITEHRVSCGRPINKARRRPMRLCDRRLRYAFSRPRTLCSRARGRGLRLKWWIRSSSRSCWHRR